METATLYDTDALLFNLLAVAKALRQAAEGKASAQAEAAEWKRKYELERSRNLHLERKGTLPKRILHYYLVHCLLQLKFIYELCTRSMST